jgi:Na+-driven multidrug efflux pump
MVSNVIGQGKKEEVLHLIKKIMMLSLSIALAVCVLLNLFPNLYLSIYGQSQDFVEAAVPVLRLITVILVLMSAAAVWLHAVTGTGNSRMTFLIELTTLVFYCIYVYLVLEVYHLSIFWGWVSEVLYWSLMFLLSLMYMLSGKWKKKVI